MWLPLIIILGKRKIYYYQKLKHPKSISFNSDLHPIWKISNDFFLQRQKKHVIFYPKSEMTKFALNKYFFSCAFLRVCTCCHFFKSILQKNDNIFGQRLLDISEQEPRLGWNAILAANTCWERLCSRLRPSILIASA